MAKKRELNKPLIRKMIAHYQAYPESFDQNDFGSRHTKAMHGDRPKPPCGTVACLAGTAVICAASDVKKGARELMRKQGWNEPTNTAAELLGLTKIQTRIFTGGAFGWPRKFKEQYRAAKDYKGQARAAISFLRYMLRTGSVS